VRGLGDLEADLMNVLWAAAAPMPVREVQDVLAAQKVRAYTTVMTVLDNLYRKGYVQRTKQGKAFLYSATVSRAQAAADSMREVLSQAEDVQSALLHFANAMTDGESQALRDGLKRRRRSR